MKTLDAKHYLLQIGLDRGKVPSADDHAALLAAEWFLRRRWGLL